MNWKIKYESSIKYDWKKIDKKQKEKILNFINNKLAKLKDPRIIGDPLKGPKLNNFWRYRVGNYRIITDIQDKLLIIVVIRIGHQKDVYKE